MKPSTAFRALNARHRNESNATKTLVVRRVNKDGTPSRTPLTSSDMQLNAFAIEADADRNPNVGGGAVVSTAVYEVRTGDSRIPVRLLKRGRHLYLVEVIGQDATTWVMPEELVAVGTPAVGVSP